MPATVEGCPACGRHNRPTAWRCAGCRRPLVGPDHRPAGTTPQGPPRREPAIADPGRHLTGDRHPGRRRRPAVRPATADLWIAAGAGAVLCTWQNLGGVVAHGLYFLSALTHEIGHAAWATLCGAPAFPVISLRGHAAALHAEQSTWLAVGIWLFFGYLAFTLRREHKPWRAWAWLAAIYPLLALTGLWHPLFLLAGHGGELAFAGVFGWRFWTGGFTHSRQERLLYGVLAVFLAASNCVFHLRLMTSAGFRAHYQESGSFGLVNDYIRVAGELGTSLPAVAGGMLLVNVVALPLVVWLLVRWWQRH